MRCTFLLVIGRKMFILLKIYYKVRTTIRHVLPSNEVTGEPDIGTLQCLHFSQNFHLHSLVRQNGENEWVQNY